MTLRWPAAHAGLLLVGVIVTVLAAVDVADSQWLFPGAVVTVLAVALTAFVNDELLLTVLVLAALLQPPIVSIGAVPQLQLDELLVPIMLGITLVRWGLDLNRRNVVPSPPARTAYKIHVLVGAYGVVLALNALRSKFLIPSVKGVNRAYYDYFVALGVYLLFYCALRAQRLDLSRLLRVLLAISLIVSAVGLIAVLLHLPLNLGDLRYSVADYQNGAVRVGFLEVAGIVGLALLLTHPPRFAVAAGAVFVAALIASGGRASLIGSLVACALYLLITRRSRYLVACVVVAAIGFLVAPGIGESPQIQRLTNVNSQEFNADGRTLIYQRSLSGFASDPFFGTGIGVPTTVDVSQPDVAAFYEAQLEVGGHAAYITLLKNVGLAGFLPFVLVVLLAISALAKRAARDPRAGFFFVFLTAVAISLLAGGNGSETSFFLALAGAAAILAESDENPVRAASTARQAGAGKRCTDGGQFTLR